MEFAQKSSIALLCFTTGIYLCKTVIHSQKRGHCMDIHLRAINMQQKKPSNCWWQQGGYQGRILGEEHKRKSFQSYLHSILENCHMSTRTRFKILPQMLLWWMLRAELWAIKMLTFVVRLFPYYKRKCLFVSRVLLRCVILKYFIYIFQSWHLALPFAAVEVCSRLIHTYRSGTYHYY